MKYITALLLVATIGIQATAQPPRPNIVLILADDFGVGDIQAHYPDNKIATPHLDRLAAQGMSFTDAHSASAVCSPTRYGLLTGRYSWRTRLQEWVLAAYEPPLISKGQPTLPGYLRQKGYHTACVGKWHLGWNWPGPQPSRMDERGNILAKNEWDFTKPIQDGPTTRGFDYYFGTHVPNFPPFTFIENDRIVTQPTADYEPHPGDGVNLPRNFIGCPTAPGWRMTEILPTLTERAVKYVHEQAKTDEPFFLFFSMTSPHEPVSPSEPFQGKSGIAPIADFVMETDWSAGQVIKAVEDAGIADNTLIIFTADNGHSNYTGWNHLVKAGHKPSGPFRGHKGNIWEGGHRVPFIVRWPGRVKANSSNDQLLCLNDVMATCAELLGDELPNGAGPDSFSFLQNALGNSDKPFRPNLVSHSVDGEFAYREGKWKLVFKAPGRRKASRGKQTVAELYNLENDIAETNNLAAAQPQVVERLTAQLQRVVDRGGSRPSPAQPNDTRVRFDIVQTERWAPALMADKATYLADIAALLEVKWPRNRAINIVCHGHSVPAGYFKTPVVDTFNAYPHLLHKALKQRYPHAVINVINTSIGGETSDRGAARFAADVLTHKPDIVTIDYALNDRRIGLEKAAASWSAMIEAAKAAGAKVILLTPTGDHRAKMDDPDDPLNQHARQIRELAARRNVALADSYAAFRAYVAEGGELEDLMSQVNHPNRKGHDLVVDKLMGWFAEKPAK